MDLCGPLCTSVDLCGPLWPSVDLCGPLWTLCGYQLQWDGELEHTEKKRRRQATGQNRLVGFWCKGRAKLKRVGWRGTSEAFSMLRTSVLPSMEAPPHHEQSHHQYQLQWDGPSVDLCVDLKNKKSRTSVDLCGPPSQQAGPNK